jgi:glutathionyl-hydroquinone reductase
MDQIKLHYYASHPDLNKWSIVAKGANFEEKLKEEHNRASVVKKRKL